MFSRDGTRRAIGRTSNFFVRVAAMYPARVAGGDYYDYTVSPDGNLRLVIADVSGKGVAAALLMAATAAAVCVETDEPRRFRTVLFGELDSRSRRLKYINCGHSPALLFRPVGGAMAPRLLHSHRVVEGVELQARRDSACAFRHPGVVHRRSHGGKRQGR